MNWLFQLNSSLPVALVLGRFGRIGRLVCHMPVNANLAFRDFGIALFFAAVGLDAGARFFATLFSATGLQWMLAGACVTMLPLLLVGALARIVWNMNFVDLSGLLAGSTTNPPALPSPRAWPAPARPRWRMPRCIP